METIVQWIDSHGSGPFWAKDVFWSLCLLVLMLSATLLAWLYYRRKDSRQLRSVRGNYFARPTATINDQIKLMPDVNEQEFKPDWRESQVFDRVPWPDDDGTGNGGR